MEPMIQARTLTGYSVVARRHGLNPYDLMREVGLDAGLLVNPAERMSATAACKLLEISAERSACETFALEMAELREKFDVGAIGLLLAHKRTLREALTTAVHYRHLLNDALGLYLETNNDIVTIREDVICDAPIQTRQATELAVGMMDRVCRALLGQSWKPRSVNFMHSAPGDLRFQRRFFDCPVLYESDFNGIVCGAADLDLPNTAAEPELVQYAESLVVPLDTHRPGSIVLEVRKTIYLLLPLGQASIKDVARALHLSTRTMQRRLKEVDYDFASLLVNVRHNLAVRYLVNARHPIGRIAELLGFSSQASFTRWFIAHFGMTPRAWRMAQSK
jgi:AraC-like DNA-binding protein